MKKIIIVIIIMVILIPINKIMQDMEKENKEAYNNCMQKTSNSVYCNNIIYGN